MSQLYDKPATSVLDKLIDDVGDWIDQYNLASMIVGAINEEYGIVTLEMAQDLWYRALEYHLPELFDAIARRLPDPTCGDD